MHMRATETTHKGRPFTPEEAFAARRHAARIAKARQAKQDAMQAAADWVRGLPGRVSEPAIAQGVGVNRRTVRGWLGK